VADRPRAGQFLQDAIIEDLRHETHAVVALEFMFLVAMGHDAGAFLPAMLQGIEAIERDLRRVGMTEDAKYPTLILGTVLKNSLRRG